MSFCIGLTGGIASGKSCVLAQLALKGIDTFSADNISRQLTLPGTLGLSQITAHFGTHLLNADGTLNRPMLGDIIFSNETDRLWLNKLLHPLIRQAIKHAIKKSTSYYCVCEIPLLSESTGIDFIDRVCVLTTTPTLQAQRLSDKNWSAEKIASVLNTQDSQEKRLRIADDIINNSSDLANLQCQVDQLHRQWLKRAAYRPQPYPYQRIDKKSNF